MYVLFGPSLLTIDLFHLQNPQPRNLRENAIVETRLSELIVVSRHSDYRMYEKSRSVWCICSTYKRNFMC